MSILPHPPGLLTLVVRANFARHSFGGFASKYIKGRFFMDVHPPLAKLLITLAGWVAGFNGDFDFKDIGKDYVEPRVPYVAMRLLPALMGVLTIPTMFLTLKASGCQTLTSAMGAALLIFGTMPYPSVGAGTNSCCRERFCHTVPTDSFGLTTDRLHRIDRPVIHLLHEPARARPIQSLRS